MKPRLNLDDMVFGRYTVTGFAENRYGNATFWNVRCECGQTRVVRGAHLKSGAAKSCGCLKREVGRERATKHGGSETKTYWIWSKMKDRCTNPNNSEFKWYGAKGVVFCDRWRDFKNFLADMGYCPSGFSIERKDPFANYCPENCIWIPRSEQNLNKRNSVKYKTGPGEVPNIKGFIKGKHFYEEGK